MYNADLASTSTNTSSPVMIEDASLNDIGNYVERQVCKNWKNAVEIFNKHQNADYHKFSVLRAENRLAISEKKKESIDMILDSSLKQQIESNSNRLLPIIDTVIFCGRQGLSLRGHRDSGPIDIEKPEPTENDGNFRALLRFRMRSGDENLKRHLTIASKNATYISPRIQNKIISACNSIMVLKLVANINSAQAFSVLADETADISGMEQLSLCVRYLDKNTSTIREDFLQFVPVSDLTGKGLAKTIIDNIKQLGIDSKFMVGQGYDGAAAMSGCLQEAQKYIREHNSLAIYVHCASHCLNLAISDSCQLPNIRNCMGSLESIYNFLNTAKRQAVLKNAVVQLCPTRWVQRHDSVLVFLELQQATIEILEIISQWEDKTSSASAMQLLLTIRSAEFQTSLHVISKVFALTLSLSRQLQAENQNLSVVVELATDVQNALTDMRTNANESFSGIFKKVTTFCEELGIEVKMPRISKRQTKRCNVQAESAEEYYRIAVFIPFLDNVIGQIQNRILEHKALFGQFKCLFSSKSPFSDAIENSARNIVQKYQHVLDCGIEEAVGKLNMWLRRTGNINDSDKFKSAFDAYLSCNAEIFPTVKRLLQIFLTIPVTTATNERSFSTLRRLKTYLRNTTREERLNGLALLNIHRDIIINNESVLELANKNAKN